MSKKFMENALRILKSVYYMEKPEDITREIKRNMSSREFAEVIIFLEKKGLINIYEKECPFHINLTDRGIEFFVNYQNRENQKDFNKIIALTGCILVLISVYGFLNDLKILDPPSMSLILFIFLLLIAGCLAPVINFVYKWTFKEEN